jgi:hypothetical protein
MAKTPGLYFFKKHKLLVLYLDILIIFFAAIIFHFFNPSLGFHYFEPTYLPPNVSIKQKRITMYPKDSRAELNFRTEDWVYQITEGKTNNGSVGDSPQNYDSKSIKPTCVIKDTPANMHYRLCHWIDYGRIDVHEVTFTKNGTGILLRMPSETKQDITIDQIERFIDSFQPKSIHGIKINRYSHYGA